MKKSRAVSNKLISRDSTRRGLIAGAMAALSGLAAFKFAFSSSGTPSAAEGPFYPLETMRHEDADNDLVKIIGQVAEAGGEVFVLRGKVVDSNGNAKPGYRVEIWQCDVNGKYLHSGDDQDIAHDTGFQGFGHDITNAEGEFQFRTIKPVSYPGRTPHIHAKLFNQTGRELLTTQLYVDGHPQNLSDYLYNRMSQEQAALVSMKITDNLGVPEAFVYIVV